MKIFDTNYKVKIVKKPTRMMEALDCVGYCDFQTKEIYVLDNKDKEDTLIHELVHASLHSLAREDMANDEDTVNLITKVVRLVKKLVG